MHTTPEPPASPHAAESARHLRAMHRLGRWGTVGALLIMLGIPTLLGLRFDCLPSFGQVFQTALPLLMIFVPSSLSEVLYYTPVLGSSVYLSFITGEIINVKLPVAENALKQLHVEAGTEDADVIATLAVGVSSLLVMGLVVVCVALFVPLQPVLTRPEVQTVSANVLPALFGALAAGALGGSLGGGLRAAGRWKSLLLPAVLTLLIARFDRELSLLLGLDVFLGQPDRGVIMSSFRGFVILALLPLTYYGSKLLYKRGHIRISAP
ncbi:MAG: hypothetical protein LBK75_02645 [Oscillospiraceae bacterium]|jgi:hypothetical protein|nr:hypothetical protein [Oscillospiraceae bacterium]